MVGFIYVVRVEKSKSKRAVPHMGHETQIGSRWSMGSMDHMLGRRQPQDLKGAKDKRQNTKKIMKTKKRSAEDEGAYIAAGTWLLWPNFKGLPKGFLQNCISITFERTRFGGYCNFVS